MKIKHGLVSVLTFLIFLLWFSSTIAKTPPLIPKDDLVRIGEAYHLWKSLGDTLWEGWTNIHISFLLVKEKYEYLINPSKKPQKFTFYEHNSYLDKDIYFRKRSLPEKILAAFPVEEGIFPVVMGSPEKVNKSSTLWVLTVLQEMFHVFQSSKGEFAKTSELNISDDQTGMWQIQYPFPYSDTIVNFMIQDLAYTLFRLNSSSDGKNFSFDLKMYNQERAIFKDYLKLKYADDKNYKYAKFQEWKEGIGDYTEINIARLAAEKEYKPNPDFTKLTDFIPYKEIFPKRYSQRLDNLKYLTTFNWGRVVFYELGAAQGFLLDKIKPDWKKIYFDPELWLDDILDEAIQEKLEEKK